MLFFGKRKTGKESDKERHGNLKYSTCNFFFKLVEGKFFFTSAKLTGGEFASADKSHK